MEDRQEFEPDKMALGGSAVDMFVRLSPVTTA
jgi:hypothetical protein